MLNENKLNQRMVFLMESGFFGKKILKEEVLSSEEVENLKRLINSGDPINVEMAFNIASGHPDIEMEILKHWLSLLVDIEDLDDLQKLSLEDYNLKFLPESIGSLTNLKELNLGYNKFTSLPESFGKLTSLEELWVYQNNLTSLPEWIGGLTGLKKLSFSHNQLTTISDSIGSLTNLKELHLHVNQLTVLPDSIGSLTSLKRLSLYGNPLPSEEKEKIEGMLPNCDINF